MRDPYKNVWQKLSFLSRKKKRVCIHSFIHSFIHSRAFWGHSNGRRRRRRRRRRTREGRKRERKKVGKKHSEGRAKRTGERAVLDEGGERKGKVNFNHPAPKSIAFLSRRLVLLYPRAAARDWNARDSLCRAFFCFAFVFLLSQVYKRRGNVFYLSTKEELLRETKEKLAEMSE